ncbi:MAG: transposase [Clostridiales bacterium]|nr:transposase [Clostridiales bacterium]
MLKRTICYYPSENPKYAKIVTPTLMNGEYKNVEKHLGSIVDKEKGIFRNKGRGLFKFTLEDGYTNLAENMIGEMEDTGGKLKQDFGDAFVLHSALAETGLWKLVYDLLPEEGDTLCTLALYGVLRGHSKGDTVDWRNSSYVRMICPNAKVGSQESGKFYKRIIDEGLEDKFFKAYFEYIGRKTGKEISLNSADLVKSIICPGMSNSTEKGSKMILAVDRKTGTPLFYSLFPGNTIDASAIKSALNEFSGYGLDVSMALMGAGYASGDNVKAFLDGGVKCLVRLKANYAVYKEMMERHIETLKDRDNRIVYENKIFYGVRLKLESYGHESYGYLCADEDRCFHEKYEYDIKDLSRKEEDRDSSEVYEKKVQGLGVFALMASEPLEVAEVLPTYLVRNIVDQTCGVLKANSKAPAGALNEELHRGQLLVSFISAVWRQAVAEKFNGTSYYNVDEAFEALRKLKCKVFDSKIAILNPTPKQIEMARILNVDLPIVIDLPLDSSKSYALR